MNKSVDSKNVFKILDGQKRQAKHAILLTHNSTLSKGSLARCTLTRFELKTFTFSAGSKSLSIDNAVLGPIPKRVLITMFKKAVLIGSLDSNHEQFSTLRHQRFFAVCERETVP